jgi:hypothetical protein
VVHKVAANLIGAIGQAGRVLVIRGGQEEDRGVDGAGTHGEKPCGVDRRVSVAGCWRCAVSAGCSAEP